MCVFPRTEHAFLYFMWKKPGDFIYDDIEFSLFFTDSLYVCLQSHFSALVILLLQSLNRKQKKKITERNVSHPYFIIPMKNVLNS